MFQTAHTGESNLSWLTPTAIIDAQHASMLSSVWAAKDVTPVQMKMHAANNDAIKILGALILRFSGKCKQEEVLDTRQLAYVTDLADNIFLGREAL